MGQDAGNQSARSILLRRLSSNPTTPPASNRRGSMRAVKANVGGTSPHSIQRRRTTASHTGRAPHLVAQDHFNQRRRQQEGGYRPKEPSRPMSWHPNSRSFDTPSGYCPSNEPAMRNTIAGLQSLAVTSIGAAGGESPLRNPLPAGPNYAVNLPSTTTVHPTGGFHDAAFSNNPPIVYIQRPSYAWPTQYQGYFSEVHPPYDPGFYPSTEIQPPSWSKMPDFTTSVPLPVPGFLPVQRPSETPDSLASGGESQLPRKRSKELVGMGLYDNPDDDLWSDVDYDHGSFLYHLANPHRASTGKGLKLEETWEPPKDQDGAEEDEAYSSDEAEEEHPVAPTEGQSQATFYPPYGDLSNQSFFFDNDDPYSACIALDPGLPPYPPKLADPVTESLLWC